MLKSFSSVKIIFFTSHLLFRTDCWLYFFFMSGALLGTSVKTDTSSDYFQRLGDLALAEMGSGVVLLRRHHMLYIHLPFSFRRVNLDGHLHPDVCLIRCSPFLINRTLETLKNPEILEDFLEVNAG